MQETRDRVARRRVGASALLMSVCAAVVCLAGCSSGGTSGGASEQADALPPVIVDLDSLDGTTVEVAEGGSIDLTGDDETFTEWTADIADPDVVEFVPGRDDGSAQFNPGLSAESVGETEVVLENGETGDTVTFTVEVVPRAGDY
jgi:hypothetical protein